MGCECLCDDDQQRYVQSCETPQRRWRQLKRVLRARHQRVLMHELHHYARCHAPLLADSQKRQNNPQQRVENTTIGSVPPTPKSDSLHSEALCCQQVYVLHFPPRYQSVLCCAFVPHRCNKPEVPWMMHGSTQGKRYLMSRCDRSRVNSAI